MNEELKVQDQYAELQFFESEAHDVAFKHLDDAGAPVNEHSTPQGIVISLKPTPFNSVRVGLGPDYSVYVPIEENGLKTIQDRSNRQPLWSTEFNELVVELFVLAFKDCIRVWLEVRTRDEEHSAQLERAA